MPKSQAQHNIDELHDLLYPPEDYDRELDREDMEAVGEFIHSTGYTTGNTRADELWNWLKDQEEASDRWGADLVDDALSIAKYTEPQPNPGSGWRHGIAAAGLAALGVLGLVMGHRASKQ